MSPTDTWILITGENGTGKELVARTIHQLSSRVDYPLITVNCAAIPEELIESELFGHEKGAFSGETSKKRGKFELANNGTIFLDEIGDMSLKTQAKILRVLQDQQFQRVGGDRILSVNVRVIAASNKDLEEEIEKGNFREDLYYRLNVIPVEVTPLRERSEDIPLLVETFLDECAKQNRSTKKTMTKETIKLLCAYSWPGNVRELKNLVERLTIMVEEDIIEPLDLPTFYNPVPMEKTKFFEEQFFLIDYLKDAKRAFEKAFIQRKLLQNKNDISKTAKAIGVKQSYLNKKIK